MAHIESSFRGSLPNLETSETMEVPFFRVVIRKLGTLLYLRLCLVICKGLLEFNLDFWVKG